MKTATTVIVRLTNGNPFASTDTEGYIGCRYDDEGYPVTYPIVRDRNAAHEFQNTREAERTLDRFSDEFYDRYETHIEGSND